MIRIWTKNISPNFILKEVLEILCRKISIPKSEPTLPPRNESNKKTNSEILRLFCFAFCLSKPKSKKLSIEIAVKYNIISSIKRKEKGLTLLIF